MGDKDAARRPRSARACRSCPARRAPLAAPSEARGPAGDHGYPILPEGGAGGGGRGMRVVAEPMPEVQGALAPGRQEAGGRRRRPAVRGALPAPPFGHVEVQVLGDSARVVVELGERDCSVQRRHQKVVEEGPAPAHDGR